MEGFEAKIWPEAALPGFAEGCMNCELSRQRKRIIWGEGNPGASVYIVLDNPGARETPEGEAFLCGTRETLQRAAYETGFGANDLFVTYILKCRPIRAYDKEGARSSCLPYLRRELEAYRPEVLFCMGNVAVQAYLGDPHAEVKSLRGQVLHHGGLDLVVTYHPLAVRRRPNLFPAFLQDWKLMRDVLNRRTDTIFHE